MPVNFGLDQAKIHITWPKNCKKTGICLLRMHQIEINQYPETGDQHDAMLCTACFVLDANIRGIQSVTETLALNRERGVFHSCIPPHICWICVGPEAIYIVHKPRSRQVAILAA